MYCYTLPRYSYYLPTIPIYDNDEANLVKEITKTRTYEDKEFFYLTDPSVTKAFLPYVEEDEVSPLSVYGKTKLIIEDMLKNLYKSCPGWKIINLRYFNPVGAHDSGLIGEVTKGKPNNLMPLMLNVASGEQNFLNISYYFLNSTHLQS